MSAMIHAIQTTILLAVIGAGTYSQSSSGSYRRFNDFINNNSLMDNATTPDSANTVAGTSSSSSSTSDVYPLSDRDDDILYQMRQRSRRHRLESIRYEILSRLGRMNQHQPHSRDMSVVREALMTLNLPALNRQQARLPDPAPRETIHRRCYSGSCEIPHKVNETMWRNSSAMGLRLYVPIPRDISFGNRLRAALLNLFIKPNAVRRASCQGQAESGGSDCRTRTGLLVTVYQFVRPLSIRRRGRVVNRRRLLDAKFVPDADSRWVVFNVGNVAYEWKNRKNFGLEVTVKDDNDTELDAKSIFVPPDCSVGRGEIGCREESDDNEVMMPRLYNIRDNFPYVDISFARVARSSRRNPFA